MAAQTYWHDETNIWVIDHAGKTTLSELERISEQAKAALTRHQSVCVMVDLTEVMYTEGFLKQAYDHIHTEHFMDDPLVKHIAFVIPGGPNTPLHKQVAMRQEQANRTHKTHFFTERDEALKVLCSLCNDC